VVNTGGARPGLEDLHWSDYATLDPLALVARLREPARLLLLGTYRPVEVIVHAHPLRAVTGWRLSRRTGRCADIELGAARAGRVDTALDPII